MTGSNSHWCTLQARLLSAEDESTVGCGPKLNRALPVGDGSTLPSAGRAEQDGDVNGTLDSLRQRMNQIQDPSRKSRKKQETETGLYQETPLKHGFKAHPRHRDGERAGSGIPTYLQTGTDGQRLNLTGALGPMGLKKTGPEEWLAQSAQLRTICINTSCHIVLLIDVRISEVSHDAKTCGFT